MSIDGWYHVYSQLTADTYSSNPRPFGNEFSLLQVEPSGNKKKLTTFSPGIGGVALEGDLVNGEYVWKKEDVNPAWEARARFVENNNNDPSELLVGWMRRGNLKDIFVAVKTKADSNLLTNTPDYDLYIKKDTTTRPLNVTLSGTDVQFTFTDPEGNVNQTAKAPSDQTPGRFNANKNIGSYNLVGFRLPRFIKVNDQKRVVLVGFFEKKTKAAGPGGTDDIEPFVAVSTTPPNPEGSPS